jgi:hypothetical protein
MAAGGSLLEGLGLNLAISAMGAAGADRYACHIESIDAGEPT